MPAILSDLVELGGAGLVVVDLNAASPAVVGTGVVRLGLARGSVRPMAGLEAFDILLCDDIDAPAPWVGVAPDQLEPALEAISSQIERQPVAAALAAQVLRMTLQLDFGQALALESIGYSMLLASEGFRAWRRANPPRNRMEAEEPRVRITDDEGAITIELDRPAARNAFDARMRDELGAALDFAAAHPDAPPVVLCGRGPAFSAGGDLDEFGRAEDVGVAHLIRTLRSPARLVHGLGERLTVRAHGACIGAGIEVAAAAALLTARRGAFFRLPEVSMGLIPGAGGTASVPRRIGRHRACYMAISGADIDLGTALAWGLVDEVEVGG